MAEAPRNAHWDIDNMSLSGLDLESPFIDGSMISMVSTSSLEYLNSQLVAHGFTTAPGVSLNGLSNADQERVTKCLFAMLSQRLEDMSRAEELTTKLRTLSYDHERLLSMHSTAMERAANAEREMNLHKSRLTTVNRTLQATETAHRHTTGELQRTRTTLLGIRATHQSELKKKEKEIERMSEKWSKLADTQLKLMTIPSGMRCANVAVVEGSEIIGKGQGFLEVALEEAEKARGLLFEENMMLRKLVLTAINRAQSINRQAKLQVSGHEEESTPFTLTTLFSLNVKEAANEKLDQVLTSLRDHLVSLCQSSNIPSSAPKPSNNIANSDKELERLQTIITSLRDEIEQSRKRTFTQAAETQAMFDKFAEDHRVVTHDIGEISVELMIAPIRDEEKERIDIIKRDLDCERQNFTEAAIKLGKERAALEAERLKLSDERRAWQVEMMLAELPSTPQPSASPSRMVAIRSSSRKSPRRSPAKVCVGKAGSSTRKTTRVSRRSLASPIKISHSYETEVLHPILAPTFDTKLAPISLLSTSFVLPPPSPHSSLPTKPALPPSLPSLETLESLEIQQAQKHPLVPVATPSTPPAIRRPFPVAKSFAQRMVHAYSPAKPSPLSRILMLGNSPNSPDGLSAGDSDLSNILQPVVEEDEDILGFTEVPGPSVPAQLPQMSLAAELGVETPPDSPLQEKKLEPNVISRPITISANVKTARGRVFHPDPTRLTAKEKGKGKAEHMAQVSRVRTSAGLDKENNAIKSNSKIASVPKVSLPEVKNLKPTKPVTKPISAPRARPALKFPPPIKSGGARRVLVDSADAPPMSRGWKG